MEPDDPLGNSRSIKTIYAQIDQDYVYVAAGFVLKVSMRRRAKPEWMNGPHMTSVMLSRLHLVG